ncbi:hypothetical protein LCGC14_1376800 [marine sediment metagenome]|uniref:Uncharacterized protein n=1 Tax=marine sediment metagenome TaxID=412755 RepID=A0A0F9MJ73_9ZZZZ
MAKKIESEYHDQLTLRDCDLEPIPIDFDDPAFRQRFERARFIGLCKMLNEPEDREKFIGEEYFP